MPAQTVKKEETPSSEYKKVVKGKLKLKGHSMKKKRLNKGYEFKLPFQYQFLLINC